MRAISKILAGGMIAAAALSLSACGSKTETTETNTMVTDLNTTEGMDTMTDNMTAVDGASNGGAMANGMGGNDTMMMSNTTTTTTTTNAM